MFWNKKWIDHGPRNKTWYHVTSWRILGCPDDSLKIHGDEKVHFGHPRISGKWLEWRILWSWAATPSFRKFDRKIFLSNWFEVVDMTNVRQNSTAFLADISLLEGRMGTDIRETLTLLTCADYRTFLCILRHLKPFLGFFSPSGSFLLVVPMERLRAIARSSWSRVHDLWHVTCDWGWVS